MSELRFRQAQRVDVDSIFEMRNASANSLTKLLGEGHWSGQARRQSIRVRIDCGNPDNPRKLTLYVATMNEFPVGSVCVSSFPPGFWKRQYWREPCAVALGVFHLVVHPTYQRKGIGRFLMQQVELIARSHGIDYVRLDAYSLNPVSREFYRSLGYEERHSIDVRSVALVMMEKRLI